jgi:prepilin-type N-terminal cleavage/methylation domain-containing protein
MSHSSEWNLPNCYFPEFEFRFILGTMAVIRSTRRFSGTALHKDLATRDFVMKRHARAGFTALELLISIAVFTILIAVLIPAVHSVHESSRSVACRNNFRQVSLALQNYVTSFRQFPKTNTRHGTSFVMLLPFLEKQALYDVLVGQGTATNSRTSHVSPREFKCPSDPVAMAYAQGCSLGENIGVCVSEIHHHTETGRKYDGVFLSQIEPFVVTPASISDGLSNTAAYSEILAFPRPDFRQKIYTRRIDIRGCFSAEDQAMRCRLADYPLNTTPMARGTTWRVAAMEMNQYVHALPPNTRECRFVPNAASTHPASAYSAMCDGSVKLISTSIDEKVWQAVGSRSSRDFTSGF